MKKLGLLGILMIILMTTGCAAVEGKVVGKDTYAGRYEDYTVQQRRSCGVENYTTTVNGKTVTRSRTKYCSYPVTQTRRVPPRWSLNILKDDGGTQWVDVSELAWRRTQIGDRVNTGNLR